MVDVDDIARARMNAAGVGSLRFINDSMVVTGGCGFSLARSARVCEALKMCGCNDICENPSDKLSHVVQVDENAPPVHRPGHIAWHLRTDKIQLITHFIHTTHFFIYRLWAPTN